MSKFNKNKSNHNGTKIYDENGNVIYNNLKDFVNNELNGDLDFFEYYIENLVDPDIDDVDCDIEETKNLNKDDEIIKLGDHPEDFKAYARQRMLEEGPYLLFEYVQNICKTLSFDDLFHFTAILKSYKCIKTNEPIINKDDLKKIYKILKKGIKDYYANS